jgi:hypothetical protein
LVLVGCAAKEKSAVWTAYNVSFADYKVLEVRPVANATNRSVEQEMLSKLTDHLTERFAEKGLPLTDSSEITSGVLIVKTDLVVYEDYKYEHAYGIYGSGGWVETKCSLRTRLVDKANNHIVAEISTVKVASAEGLGSIPVYFGPPLVKAGDIHEEVLNKAVSTIAEEVAKLMAPKEPR